MAGNGNCVFAGICGGTPCVDSNDIVDGEIQSQDVGTRAIKRWNIKNKAVTGAKVKDESLTGADILDGSLEGADISSTTSLEIDGLFAAGNVGIGTNDPFESLSVIGDIRLTGRIGWDVGDPGAYLSREGATSVPGVPGQGLRINVSRSANESVWFTSNSDLDLVKISADGNVGIGTTNPTEKLEVNGNLKVTGDIVGNFAGTLKTYDSGWFAVTKGNTYALTHNLGTTKMLCQLYFSVTPDGTGPTGMQAAEDMHMGEAGSRSGQMREINTNSFVVTFGSQNANSGPDNIDRVDSGYARVIALALE
jgi:hypothetical protein